jgi:hypothetical protein
MVDSLPPPTDSKLTEAIRRRDAALQEAAGWEDFIRRYNMLSGVPSSIRTQAPKSLPSNLVLAKPPFGGYKTPKSRDVLKTLEVVRDIIKERGHPVGTTALFQEVTKRGVKIGGKSPKVNFDGRLRYAADFINIKGHGWWLKDDPIPTSNGLAADTHEMSAAQEDQASST